MKKILYWMCLGVVLLASVPASADVDGEKMAKVCGQLGGSVVEVKYLQTFNYMNQSQTAEGTAPGVLVDASGLVMIPGSVVNPPEMGSRSGMDREKPKDWKVEFADEQELLADYVGADSDAGVAFVRVREATRINNPLPLIFSEEPVAPGERVVAVGALSNRYRPNRKFQEGRVNAVITRPSYLYSTTVGLMEFMGGPVATLDGRVIGVVGMESDFGLDEQSMRSSVFSSMFGGYVLPATTFTELIANPPADEEEKKGWLGVELQALDKDTAEYLGVSSEGGIYITRVLQGSPAGEAGIQAEDVLLEMDGEALNYTKPEHLTVFRRKMRTKAPGEKVAFKVFSGSEEKTVEVTLGETPKSRMDAEKFEAPALAMTVRELVLDDRLELNLGPEEKGVIVLQAESGGAAEIAELTTGDVIRQMENQPTETIAQFKEIYGKLKAEKKAEVLVFVLRNGRETKFIRVKPDWTEDE